MKMTRSSYYMRRCHQYDKSSTISCLQHVLSMFAVQCSCDTVGNVPQMHGQHGGDCVFEQGVTLKTLWNSRTFHWQSRHSSVCKNADHIMVWSMLLLYSVICSGYTTNADKCQSEWKQSLKTQSSTAMQVRINTTGHTKRRRDRMTGQ